MELVSSSKFKRAFDIFEKGKNYFELLNETFEDISDYVGDSPFFKEHDGKRKTIIVIAGDRGLVGGFNINLYKMADALCEDVEKAVIVPFGKKAWEHYKNDERVEVREQFSVCDKITPESIRDLSAELSKAFLKGESGEIHVVYTKYLTMLSQEATNTRILPITPEKDRQKTRQMIFEPSSDGVLHSAVPEYVSGILYGALCESIVSENAARRMAMDSATKNAGEIIDSLTLEYNRARQSAITQEITEIVAGSEK